MKTERQRLIEKEIARITDNAAPYLLEERLVITTLNITLKPKATLDEFEKISVGMEEQAWIKRVRTDDGVKIKLTDEGRAELL